MNYYTLDDIKNLLSEQVSIINVHFENKWIVIELDNGIRFKIKNWG